MKNSSEGIYPSSGSELGYTCPQSTTVEQVRAKVPSYQRNHQAFKLFSHVRVFETRDFLLRYDFSDGIWAMCVKDMFTVDADVKDGLTKEEILIVVFRYTEFMHNRGIDLLLRCVESDRGMHFYLISERLSYGDDRSLKMSIDMCTDVHYIVFTTFNGFCNRVAPKIKKTVKDPVTGNERKDWMPAEEVAQEFIARKCYYLQEGTLGLEAGQKCDIGYGTPDPYIEAILVVYERLIEFFKAKYAQNLESLKETRTVTWNGINYKNVNIPPVEFLEEVRAFADRTLRSVGISPNGEYQIPFSAKGWLTEFKTFLDPNTLYQCSRITPAEINKRSRDVAMEQWMLNCNRQLVSVGGLDVPDGQNPDPESHTRYPQKIVTNPTGKSYPFVFGMDGTNYLVYIQFAQLLMLDWDVKDGYPKDVPVQLVNTYLKIEKELPREDRIRQTPMVFHLMESDNGSHAYCVSHDLPYNEIPAKGSNLTMTPGFELMRRTCVDAWYIAFCKMRGYAIRVGPKVGERARTEGEVFAFKTPEQILKQFVQKDGIEVVGRDVRLEYLGEGKANPYLDSLVMMILHLQQYTMKYPNLAERLVREPGEIAAELGEHAKMLYDRDCRPLEDTSAKGQEYMGRLNKWANLIWRCPFPKNPDPNKPGQTVLGQ